MARPSCLILASLVAALAVPAEAIVAAEPLQAEVSDVATLKSPGPVHRFITSGGFGSSSFTFFDADSGKMEANISAGYISNLAIAPDQSRYYVSETYWTKGTRGAREDMVTVYDGKTLDVVGEITLPNRALAGKNTNFGISASGAKAYVYSMQPASSVFWLDLKKVALGGTVEIPGCALVYPFGDDGFSSLCGDGSLATVMIPASGTPKVTHSKPFFDANKDPIYENSIVDSRTGRAIFMSYTGLIYDAKLGAEPVVQKPWSIQQAAGLPAAGTGGTELAWRPGGRQLMALHKKTGKLFVIMHMGNYWTHKQGGTEIWVLDVNKHSLISRFPLWPVPTSGKGNDRVPYFSSLAITQDEKPVLILLSPEGGDQILDPTTGEMIRKIESAGGGAALTPDL